MGGEGCATKITGTQFVKRYHLESASSVHKAASMLVAKQILTHRNGVYEVYDKFMKEWL